MKLTRTRRTRRTRPPAFFDRSCLQHHDSALQCAVWLLRLLFSRQLVVSLLMSNGFDCLLLVAWFPHNLNKMHPWAHPSQQENKRSKKLCCLHPYFQKSIGLDKLLFHISRMDVFVNTLPYLLQQTSLGIQILHWCRARHVVPTRPQKPLLFLAGQELLFVLCPRFVL